MSWSGRKPIVNKPKTDRQKQLERAWDIIDRIRELGFNEGGRDFTDGQIWQAALDIKSAHPDMVVFHLFQHVAADRKPPTCDYIPERRLVKGR